MNRASITPAIFAVALFWGAAWGMAQTGASETKEASKPAPRSGIDFAEGRKLWAFQPVGHPRPPALPDDSWSQQEVDRFILERLRQDGIF